jgi:hypothetical protein
MLRIALYITYTANRAIYIIPEIINCIESTHKQMDMSEELARGEPKFTRSL